MPYMNNLRSFYFNNMKPSGLSSQLFEFNFLNNHFTLLFTITIEYDEQTKIEPLVFAKVNTQEIFELSFDNKFFAQHNLSVTKYKEMVRFFEIPYNPNAERGFSPFEFLRDQVDVNLNAIVTKKYSRSNLASIYYMENPNAIYYKTMKNWEVLNLAKPISEHKHVTSKNKIKVQHFLPDLYSIIKDRDITVVFTETPKDETTELNSIQNHIQDML